MINNGHIIGNLGQDAEIRYTQSGMAVANLSVATSANNASGERTTEWHRVVAFGPIAEMMKGLYEKGKQVYLSGRTRTRRWQREVECPHCKGKHSISAFTTEMIASQARLLGPAPAGAGREEVPIEAYDEGTLESPDLSSVPATVAAGDLPADGIPF